MNEHDWQLTNRTTNSGKALFRCRKCGWELTGPSKGRCGRCSKCTHHYGSVGHAMACENWTPKRAARRNEQS